MGTAHSHSNFLGEMNGIPNVTLNNGLEMPMIGMGTWHHGPKEEIMDGLKFAMRNGYRHIDGAHIYLNETEVGKVYAELLGSGEVKREDLFIVSKLWCTHHKREHVEPALRLTLKRLNLDYLDMYYVHHPASFHFSGEDVNFPEDESGELLHSEDDYVETWKGMEDLVAKGLVKAIGVCNFNSLQMKRLLENCKIKPAALQIESNPRFANDILRRFCEKHGILMEAYSPFGSPDLPWGVKMPHILEDETLKGVAAKHGRSTAQIALKWQLQRGVAVCAKSIIEAELLDNLKCVDIQLDDEDMAAIKSMDKNLRKIDPVKKLKNGEYVLRNKNNKYYSFDYVETEECLK